MNAIEVLKQRVLGMPDEVVITITTQQAKVILDQLEAERQRADKAESYARERDSENESIALTVGRLRLELAALRGEQEPVTMEDLRDAVAEMSGGLTMEWRETTSKGHHGVPFINFNSLHRIVSKFTRQPKPVVVLPTEFFTATQNTRGMFELSEECMCGITTGLEAAGIVVKDGE